MQFSFFSEPMMLSVSCGDVTPELFLTAGPCCVDVLHCVVFVPPFAL